MAEVREKTIRLTGLVPENYRLWASQSEATFSVYGVLDIVLGRETNPSPERAASSTPSESTQSDSPTDKQIKLLRKWQRRNNIARQALLACLEPAELTKVYHLQSAHEIWKRLADEYGGVSDLKRAQANAAFYSIQKSTTKSMHDHINEFTKLQQDVNYHRGSPLSDVDVNLAFLQSLGEEWKTFQHALGSRIHTVAPPMLFAEVIAFESNSHASASSSSFPTDPKAHHTNFKKFDNRRPKPYDRQYERPSSGKHCRYCKRSGHLIEECLKKRWKDTQARDSDEDQEDDGNSKPHVYDPVFRVPGRYSKAN